MIHARGGTSSPGFSLVEVIVALAVAATMVIAYISLTEKSLFMVSGTRSIWENINYAEEFLGQNTFTEITNFSAMFNQWDDRKEAYWRVSRKEIQPWDDLPPDFGTIVKQNDDIPTLYRYTLETKLDGAVMSWVWYYK